MEHGTTFDGADNRYSVNSVEQIEVTGVKDGASNPRGEDDHEDATPENPYNELGFGFTAYFGMLRTFICLFAAFTVIMSPLLIIYGTTDGIVIPSNAKTVKARYTLGNLGFSGATCISQYVALTEPTMGTRELVCLQGSLGELKTNYGVLPNNLVDGDSDKPNSISFPLGYSFCGPKDDPGIPPEASKAIQTCTSPENFKVDEFESFYE